MNLPILHRSERRSWFFRWFPARRAKLEWAEYDEDDEAEAMPPLPSNDGPAYRSVFGQLWREPLVHFLLVGLALWIAAAWHRDQTDRYQIVVTAERVADLKSAYESEFGAPPAEAIVPRLIDDWVNGEVLFREGQARGFDREDEIVRRRVIQKVGFLVEDLATPAEPDEATLLRFYEGHRDRYMAPGRLRFTHVYFLAEPGREEQSRQRALAVLAGLTPSDERAAERGDSFPDLYDFTGFGPDETRRLFGDSEMARELFHVPVGQWSGPFRSAFGWHLVRVGAVERGGVEPFEAVRDRVKADWLTDARAMANARRLAEIRARYTVVRE